MDGWVLRPLLVACLVLALLAGPATAAGPGTADDPWAAAARGATQAVDAARGRADPAALAEALASVLDREWDAEALRAGVMHLTWEAAARRYHDVFASVARPRPR